MLAGIAEEADSLGVRAIDLTAAVAEDMSDGVLDGMSDGVAIDTPLIAGGTTPLSASTGTVNLQSSINTFVASPNNVTNINTVVINTSSVPVGVTSSDALRINLATLPAFVSGQAGSATLSASVSTCDHRSRADLIGPAIGTTFLRRNRSACSPSRLDPP